MSDWTQFLQNIACTWLWAIFVEVIIIVAGPAKLHTLKDLVLERIRVADIGHDDAVPCFLVSSHLDALVAELYTRV